MHIPENYLSPETCAAMAVATVPVLVVSVKKVKEEITKEKMPMLGVGAAFSFLLMMFNVPLPGGTTGHAVGAVLVAILLGPYAACLSVTVALTLQALLFGDGGVLALGANWFNMAFIMPFAGYAIYRIISGISNNSDGGDVQRYSRGGLLSGGDLRSGGSSLRHGGDALQFGGDELRADNDGLQPGSDRKSGNGGSRYGDIALRSGGGTSRLRENIGIIAGAYVGINVAALAAAIEFGIQPLLFTNEAGQALYSPYPFGVSIPAMMIPHLVVAGVIEALFSVLIINFVVKLSPGSVYTGEKKRTPAVYALLGALICAVPLGLIAAGTAWGEWGADEIAETTDGGSALGYVPQGIEHGWNLETIMPDYSIEGIPEALGYVLSAICGVAIAVILFRIAAGLTRKREQRTSVGDRVKTKMYLNENDQ